MNTINNKHHPNLKTSSEVKRKNTKKEVFKIEYPSELIPNSFNSPYLSL